jgi:hypothetical protein
VKRNEKYFALLGEGDMKNNLLYLVKRNEKYLHYLRRNEKHFVLLGEAGEAE